MRKYIVSSVLVVAFLVVGSARADIITSGSAATHATTYGGGNADYSADQWKYVPASDWTVNGTGMNGDNQGQSTGVLFEIRDGKEIVITGSVAGTGSENNGINGGNAIPGDDARWWLANNNAKEVTAIFNYALDQEDFISSFFFSANAGSNNTVASLTIDAYGINSETGGGETLLASITQDTGNTATIESARFFGFFADPDFYFTRFVLSSNGNNGIWIWDLGTGGAGVPEPATIALLGLGLAGLGAARARRNRK